MKTVSVKNNNSFFGSDMVLWSMMGALCAAAWFLNGYFFLAHSSALKFTVWMVATLATCTLFFLTSQGRRLWVFGKEARAELHKVVWPGRQETMQITLVVALVVIFSSLFLWALDSVLFWLVSLLPWQRG